MFGNMLMGAAGASLAAGGGYSVDNSIVLDDGSSQYLERTFASAGNRNLWTLSMWVKRNNLSNNWQTLWSTAGYSADDTFRFESDDKLRLYFNTGGGTGNLHTTRVFRDTHSWYHIVITVDTTQATAADRVKVFVNGTQETAFDTSTYPSQNYDTITNTAVAHAIGRRVGLPANTYPDVYIAETCFIDGSALDATSFGEYDTNGVWRPIELDTATLFPNPTITDNSVNFDGTNDYLTRGGALTGLSDGDAGSTSFWFKFNGGDGSDVSIFTDNAGHIHIRRGSDNKIRMLMHTSGAAELVDIQTSDTYIADGNWHHCMASWNTTSNTQHLYIDGVDKLSVNNSATGTIDYTQTDYAVGARTSGTNKINSDLAEFYFTNEYIDLSQASNRLKFLTSDGGPASLGSDGSTPTGTAAIVYLSGATSTWHTNDGTGGGFTENGALTDGSAIQGVYGRNSFYLPFSDSTALGLDTHASATAAQAYTEFQCNFDGSDAATSATDASRNSAAITFSGNAQLDTAQQKFGTASLLLDGTGDYVSIPDASYLEIGTKDFTIDCWIRFSTVPTDQETIVSKWTGTGNQRSFNFAFEGSTSNLIIQLSGDGSSTALNKQESWSPSQDTWYHVAVERTGGNVHLYVNGTQLGSGTANSTNIYDGSATFMVGALNAGAAQNFTGHVDEVRFINGYGAYQGSNFTAPTTAYATPPSSNTFTPSGSPSQSSDTPTKVCCNFSPLIVSDLSFTLSEGNRKVVVSNDSVVRGSMALPTSGKYYFEVECVNDNTYGLVGFMRADKVYDKVTSGRASQTAGLGGYDWEDSAGLFRRETTTAYTGSTWTTGDILGFYIDYDNDAIWASKNGTLENGASQSEVEAGTTTNAIWTGTLATDGSVVPYVGCNGGTNMTFKINCGQEPFNTSLYAGYRDLSSTSFYTNAAPAIGDGTAHFQTTLYEGTGAAQDITQSGNSTFDPDLVWIKNRDAADEHKLVDRVRGATKELNSDSTNTESTDANGVDDLTVTGGFGLGTGTGGYNDSGESFVAWQWKGDNTSGSSNTDGTITSTVNVNDTAGFSIGTYTGTGSNATVGHGLSAAPEFIILKRRDSTSSWRVYHTGLTSAAYVLNMESTGGEGSVPTVWNSTAPTSTVFSIGTNAEVNTLNGTYVAYCFRSIPGFSQAFSYVGNGNSDGPLVLFDFKVAWMFIKPINNVGGWVVHDIAREPYNVTDLNLQLNGTDVEVSSNQWDMLSNGFKIKESIAGTNTNNNTYIGMAFAENPFAGSSPATAR